MELVVLVFVVNVGSECVLVFVLGLIFDLGW